MEAIKKIEQFHKTKKGYLTFAALELVLAYIFASIAVDTGNLWTYLATLILVVGVINNLLKFFGLSQNKKLRQKNNGRKTKA